MKMFSKLIFILSVLFYLGCTTAQNGSVPDWVIDPPREEGLSYVFVAYGTGSDDLEAREQAEVSLIDSIVKEFGVKITSESTSTAKATLDTFTADMVKTIQVEGSARISGFFVEDTFTEERDDKIVVWVKGLYEKAAFDKEKNRIRSLFEEQQEAVFGPEREGDSLVSRGSLFLGFTKYLEAARASAASDLENERLRTERNLNKALNALNELSLLVSTQEIRAFLGESLLEEFQVKLVSGGDMDAPGVEGATLKVSYPRMKANGRMGIGVETIKTGINGIALFKHPIPSAVGEQRISFQLDASPFVEPLWDLPRRYRDQVSAIEEKASEIRAAAYLIVESAAKSIPTGILILDVDKAGNSTGSQSTASGVLSGLTDKGFNMIAVNQNPSIIKSLAEQQVLERIQRDYGNRIDRLIIGIIAIDDFEEAEGAFIVKVAGTVKVIELESREVLFSQRLFKRTRGASLSSAISSAFRQLGNDLAERIAGELP